MSHLIYIGDPMCSWCYGFGPELAGFLKQIPEPRLDIVMGGLRAGGTQNMTPEFRQFLVEHWGHVEQASGLSFNLQALDIPGLVYDTEPVCRAFVSALILFPNLPNMIKLALFGSLQQAFYRQGQDTTKGTVLAKCVSQCLTRLKFPTSEAQFLAVFDSETAQSHTRAHFEQATRWGVSGFPALIVVKDERLFLLSSGYTKTAVLVEHFNKIQQQV
jgi:putative protein-disulfide isomerase